MDITPDLLKDETQKTVNSQMMLLQSLYSSEAFCGICDEHKASLLDLVSACTNEIFANTELSLKQDIKVFEMLDSFLEAVSKETGLHPSDASLLLTKLLVDIMVQIATLVRLQDQNKDNESEE